MKPTTESTFGRDVTITDDLAHCVGAVQDRIKVALAEAVHAGNVGGARRLTAQGKRVDAAWHAFLSTTTMDVTFMTDAEREAYHAEVRRGNMEEGKPSPTARRVTMDELRRPR